MDCNDIHFGLSLVNELQLGLKNRNSFEICSLAFQPFGCEQCDQIGRFIGLWATF